MVFLGNYFLLEMLVFTVESKADFFITPGKGRGRTQVGEEGPRAFRSAGARIFPLWRATREMISALF